MPKQKTTCLSCQGLGSDRYIMGARVSEYRDCVYCSGRGYHEYEYLEEEDLECLSSLKTKTPKRED